WHAPRLQPIPKQTRGGWGAMRGAPGARPPLLRVDGGAAENNFLCQFQADILRIPVERPAATESTALGAAYLAGLAVGFWKNESELARQLKIARRFEPAMPEARGQELFAGWQRAVERAKA